MSFPAGRRLAIIGAGPIGVAAAIAGLDRGWDVRVFERGLPGEALRRWGPTRCFTPMSMNLPARAFEILGRRSPPANALLTGLEFAELTLEPLARSSPLAGRVHVRTRVTAIGRRGMRRGDYVGHPLRSERPFRILAEFEGREEYYEADRVIDASGGYRLPNAAGWGGIPAVGERRFENAFVRDLGALDAVLGELAGRRVLLIGHGHSAATALAWFARVGASDPSTTLTWAVRTLARRPVAEVAGDPLPERQRVAREANELAEDPPPFLTVRRRVGMISIDAAAGGWLAGLSDGSSVLVDRVVAMTGAAPDSSFLSELPVEISPATQGGARLARALGSITDCLSVPRVSPEELSSGEPGFSFAGSRAYGRSPTFLLQTGLVQLAAILEQLETGS